MNFIAHAYSIASAAHSGQVDKCGAPYILHPLRVARKVKTFKCPYFDNYMMEIGVASALLHDVIEDTYLLEEDLKLLGFNESIIHVVSMLTRLSEESYKEYIEKIINLNNTWTINLMIKTVKLCDLEDNLSPERAFNSKDYNGIVKRYKKSRQEILDSLDGINETFRA